MAATKYQTREHKAASKRGKQDVARGQGWCVQGMHGSSGTCVMRSRYIAPGDQWHVAHDDSGTVIIGLAHALCNAIDGGQRSHTPPEDRWAL